MKHPNFGQIQAEGVALIGTTAANIGVNVYHSAKVSKIQREQERKLELDEIAMSYIRNLVHRFETLGTRLARTSRVRPGTPEFEALLRNSLKSDMFYRGNCKADIYVPPTESTGTGAREIWGRINPTGHLEQPSMIPPDVGPIWSSGCRTAQDKFKIAYIDAHKENIKFKHIKTSKSDIGTLGLFFTFGAGLLVLVMFILSIKTQTAVLKEQRRKPKH